MSINFFGKPFLCLGFIIFFLTCYQNISHGQSDPSLIKKISGSNIFHGETNKVKVSFNRKAAGVNVSLMPGGSYAVERFAFSGKKIAFHDGSFFSSGSEDGLKQISFSKDSKSHKINSFFSGKSIKKFFFEKNYLYFADEEGITKVLFELDKNPAELSHINFEEEITDFFVKDEFSYLLLNQTELAVLDFSSPNTPQIVTRYKLEKPVSKIQVTGNYCYLLEKNGGVLILDITTLNSITKIGAYQTTGTPLDMAIKDKYLFIADGLTGLTILDISDPANINWRSSIGGLGFVDALRLDGSKVIAKNTLSVLFSIDISRPEKPHLDEEIKVEVPVIDFEFAKGEVICLSERELTRILVSDIPPISHLNEGVNFGGSRRAYIKDDIAYVADWFSGLHIYDISNFRHPVLISSYHTPGSPKGILISGKYAYLGDDDMGLQIIDISDPLHPLFISNLRLPGLAYSMRLVGSNLYIAAHRAGINVVDVSDVAHPKRIGGFDTEGKTWALEVIGDRLFAADEKSGVLAFDISTPSTPVQIGSFNPGGLAEDLFIRDGIAYVVFFDKGLYVLDISDPKNMKMLSHIQTPGSARGIDVKDGYAYVADWWAGFHVVDIKNPEKPEIISSYDTEGGAWGIYALDKGLMLLDWWGGLKFFNIDNPEKPLALGRYHGTGNVNHIAVKENYAYSANGEGGVQIFDIKNPFFPVWIRGIDLKSPAIMIDIFKDKAVVALGESGVAVLDIKNPFQADLTDIFLTEGRVSRVRLNEQYIFAVDERAGLVIFEVLTSGKLKKINSYPGSIEDVWIDGASLYIMTKSNGVEVMDIKNPRNLKLRKKLFPESKEPLIVRSNENGLYLFEQNKGVYILDKHNYMKKGFLSVKDEVVDMTVTQSRLFLISKAKGIMEYELTGKSLPILKNIYNPPRKLTQLAAYGNWAFLAGEKNITSVKLIPFFIIVSDHPDELTLNLSDSMDEGTYNLVVRTDDGRESVKHNVITIAAPPLTKPKFTMEEYKKILEQMKIKENEKKNQLK